MTRLWYAVAPAFALLALAAFDFAVTGCTARPMVCTLVKIDGEPALGCVDADQVKGSDIRPYNAAPAPQLPERDPKDSSCSGYWKYDGCAKHQKEAHE